jgi:hypothetical protein
VAINIPNNPDNKFFNTELFPTVANIEIAKIVKVKYSGGENLYAISARRGAAIIKQITLIIPPIPEETVAIPSALPASPGAGAGKVYFTDNHLNRLLH